MSLSPTPSSTFTNSKTSYLKKRTRNQKEKYGTFPLLIIPVYVFQTAFSLINWGKWLRTSGPGPVPYCPFRFPFPTLPLSPLLPFSILPTPHLFSLDHVLRCELPYTRFDSSPSLLLLLALHQIMTTADSAPPCLYRCTMIM